MPTERDLIRGCKRQHPPSQEALYRRYWSFAMAVGLRYAPTRDDALELCHDAFLNAFRAMDRVDEDRPFGPWFRQVLVRCAVDRHRSMRRYHAAVEPMADPPDAGVAPEHSVALEADDILRLLGRLPDVQRDVFNLHEVDGYSHDEIADLLGIAPGSSRSALARARRTLQTLYTHHARTLP